MLSNYQQICKTHNKSCVLDSLRSEDQYIKEEIHLEEKEEINKTMVGNQFLPGLPTLLEGNDTCTAQNKVKQKNRGWKKPADKPKRPLSAYNIFFQLERDRIVNGETERNFTKEDVARVRIVPVDMMPKRKDRKTHGKIAFADLARQIGAKWKKLNESSKAIFTERANHEKIRYRNDITHWNLKKNNVAIIQKVDSGNSFSLELDNVANDHDEDVVEIHTSQYFDTPSDNLTSIRTVSACISPRDCLNYTEDNTQIALSTCDENIFEDQLEYEYQDLSRESSDTIPVPINRYNNIAHPIGESERRFRRSSVTEQAYHAARTSYGLAQMAIRPKRRVSIEYTGVHPSVGRYDQDPSLRLFNLSPSQSGGLYRQTMRRSISACSMSEENRIRATLNARKIAATRQLQREDNRQRFRESYLMEDMSLQECVPHLRMPSRPLTVRDDMDDWGDHQFDELFQPAVSPADYRVGPAQCNIDQEYDDCFESEDAYEFDSNLPFGYRL
jgi:HMG (high mobility group) box